MCVLLVIKAIVSARLRLSHQEHMILLAIWIVERLSCGNVGAPLPFVVSIVNALIHHHVHHDLGAASQLPSPHTLRTFLHVAFLDFRHLQLCRKRMHACTLQVVVNLRNNIRLATRRSTIMQQRGLTLPLAHGGLFRLVLRHAAILGKCHDPSEGICTSA